MTTAPSSEGHGPWGGGRGVCRNPGSPKGGADANVGTYLGSSRTLGPRVPRRMEVAPVSTTYRGYLGYEIGSQSRQRERS